MRHGVNAALLIGELFISRVPIRSDYVMVSATLVEKLSYLYLKILSMMHKR